jgi:hypothetical protein
MSVGNIMNFSAMLFVLGALLLGQQPSAEHILDLTNFVSPKEHRRLPPWHGSGGAIVGGGTGVPKKVTSPLKVSLVLLERAVSTGEIAYEVTLLNSGNEEVQLPWNLDVADMEPKGAWQSYSYISFSIGLSVIYGNESKGLPGSILLTMGSQAPQSSILLKPGERATIRAKTRLVLENAVPGQRVALRAICIPYTTTVSIKSGEIYEDSSSGEGLISQKDVVVCYGECR